VFLPKPVEVNRLLATIEQLTEKSAKSGAVVQAITPAQLAPSAALITPAALAELERMSQDPRFVARLVQMFSDDSSRLLVNIEDSLLKEHHEEFKRHIHALKGSALNLGADRLVAHCSKIGVLNSRELKADSVALAAETRAVILQTQGALADYVRTHVAASA
jgi:HPt (histidine-containing phosphotransfer) domain-containing protein